MRQVPLPRTNFPQTAVVALVTVAMLVVFGAVAAYWTWNWLAPRPVLRVQIFADEDGVPSAGALFGNLQREGTNAAPAGSAIRLLGIVAAAGDGRGYAVLQLDPRLILAVREGEDVAPGIRLAQVATDHVVLARGATRETLAWPEKITSAQSAVPQADKR